MCSMPSWVKLKLFPLHVLARLCSLLTIMGTNRTHSHEEAKQHFSHQAPLRDSLLDAVESQGAAKWSGVGVPVVVQRVYSPPYRCHQGGSSAAPPSSHPPKVQWVTRHRHGCLESLRKVVTLQEQFLGFIPHIHELFFFFHLSCIIIWEKGFYLFIWKVLLK